MFNTRLMPHVFTTSVILDLAVLVAVIIPAFIIGLRFVTAPVYLNYQRKLNGSIVPLMFPLLFVVNHWDIFSLLILVIWMNFYVFWYHIDPPENIYQQGNWQYKDNKIKDEIYKQ